MLGSQLSSAVTEPVRIEHDIQEASALLVLESFHSGCSVVQSNLCVVAK